MDFQTSSHILDCLLGDVSWTGRKFAHCGTRSAGSCIGGTRTASAGRVWVILGVSVENQSALSSQKYGESTYVSAILRLLVTEFGAAAAFSLIGLSFCPNIESLATPAVVRLAVLVTDMSLARVEDL